jgi:hypothetical protein
LVLPLGRKKAARLLSAQRACVRAPLDAMNLQNFQMARAIQGGRDLPAILEVKAQYFQCPTPHSGLLAKAPAIDRISRKI